MNRTAFILFCALTISTKSFSQKGTIKIAKPAQEVAPAKDSVTPKKHPIIVGEEGVNYTFKGINKVGYCAGVTFIPRLRTDYRRSRLFIGIQYSAENQFYKLSAFNAHTKLPETPFDKSENKSEYLKLPIGLRGNFLIAAGAIPISIGLTPKYLIRNTDQNKRLGGSDFNQFNLAANISLGKTIRFFGKSIKTSWVLNFTYSKDLFENLKDRKIYDASGAVIGSQKSKTNLLSVSIIHGIYGRRR